jgi:hypothetical protein
VRGPVAENGGGETSARQDWQQDRERLTLGTNGELEVAAAGAQVQMPAQRPTAQFPAARRRELFANVMAGCTARVAVGDQGAARLVDERLDLARRTPHDRGDRLMAEIFELHQQQRAALILRQAADGGEEFAQILALAHFI